MEDKRQFHWVDYLVFSITLAGSLGIGLYYACAGGKQKTTNEYLMGDRNLKIIPVAISLLVSFISSTAIMGTPAEMYAYGTQFSMHIFAAIIGCLMGAFLFVPLFYPLKLTSSFEYFELRFRSKAPRLLGTMIMLFTSIFVCSTGLFAPATAFQAVSDVPTWTCMVLSAIVVTIYTCLGGMKAVIWTDVFQSVIIFAGMIAIVTLGVIKVGGFGEVWRLNQQYERIEFFNMDPDPRVRTTFWSVVVMMSILWSTITATQVAVQRYCALPTMRAAKTSILLNIPGFLLISGLCCIAGVVVFAYYAMQGCDPMSSGRLRNPNQIMPYFVVDAMGYPGLPGTFIACLFSSSLSTLSSTLNAMAAVTWEDFLKWKYHVLKPSTQANITKILVVIFGVISLAVAFLIEKMGGTFIQIVFTIMGTTAGPLCGMIFLGALYPRAGPWGTILGVVVALGVCLWMAVGNFMMKFYESPLPFPNHNCTARNMTGMFGGGMTMAGNGTGNGTFGAPPGFPGKRELHGVENLYAVSYLWYPTVAIFCVLIVGFITSFIPGLRQKGRVSRKYLFPIVRCCSEFCQPPEAVNMDSDYEDEDDDVKEMDPLKMSAPWKTGDSPIFQLKKDKNKESKLYPSLINEEENGSTPRRRPNDSYA